MTEVIEFTRFPEYHEPMKDFDAWLRDMATRSLPGGVSAAALASAMGSALVAKAARVSLQRLDLSDNDRTALQAVLDLACRQQPVLSGLAQADERAYRAVLESRARRPDLPADSSAWREATEVPICVAEACHLLLRRLPGMLDSCWPPVEPDLQIGQSLIEIGLRAGLSAAQANVRARPDDKGLVPLQDRIDALKQALEASYGDLSCGEIPN